MNDIPTYRQEQKFSHVFVTLTIVFMLLLGGGLFFALRYQPESNRSWRIAITNWPGFDYLYLAQEKGFFAEQNLDITLVPINSIIDMRTAFERGLIDGYTGSIMDVVESIQESRIPARIVMVTDYSNGGDQLLADPEITSLSDLRGKRLGIELTSTIGRYMLSRALEGTGLGADDIKLVPSSQTIMIDQAGKGNLDALITYEPFASKLQSSRTMHVLFDSSRLPQEIVDVLAVSPQMQAAEPDLSNRLQHAWQSAMDYANAHPEEVHGLFAQRYGISVDDYTPLLSDVAILDRATMQRLANGASLTKIIGRVGTLVRGGKTLTPTEISDTIAVWFQKESSK